MKKRFLILKNPIRLHDPKQIENIVVTCAVLHNILLDYDGVMEEELVQVQYNGLEEAGEAAAGQGRYAHGVAGVRSRHRNELYNVDGEDEDGPAEYVYQNDFQERAEFQNQREELIEHFIYLRENVE